MKSRLVGVIVTAVILVAAYAFWRSAASPRGGAAREDAPPSRGGQIVVTIRAEPRSFNRIVARDQTTLIIDAITQGRLVRINRATFELEPWLAERWESSADGRTHTLHLRPGLQWSDGAPLTSADVLFSIDAIFDPKSNSVLSNTLSIDGKPIRATLGYRKTVVLTYPSPSGLRRQVARKPAILPKHKLEAALKAGRWTSAWNSQTPPADLTAPGPFVLREYQLDSGSFNERIRTLAKRADGGPLPYADRLVLEVVPERTQNCCGCNQVRPTSSTARFARKTMSRSVAPRNRPGAPDRARCQHRRGCPVFCLKPEAKRKDPRFAFVQTTRVPTGNFPPVDRDGVRGDGLSRGGSADMGTDHSGQPAVGSGRTCRGSARRGVRARELLKSLGLEDRKRERRGRGRGGHRGPLHGHHPAGTSATTRRHRGARDEAAKVGIALDVAPLDSAR